MGFRCGIIGLPNVGKSTLFNALTKSNIKAENFLFCTIKPNIGIVSVPDLRLNQLADIIKPKRIIYTNVEFIDIAGLLKGASKGEGLGNQFLSDIRTTEALIHVVRCFENENIIHSSSKVDPIHDINVINTELVLSDLHVCEKAILNITKSAKISNKKAKLKLEVLNKCKSELENEYMLRNLNFFEEEQELINDLNFLTLKPIMYVANIDKYGFQKNTYLDQVYDIARKDNSLVVPICATIESNIANLINKQKQTELLQKLELKEIGVNRIISAGYSLLKLQTYFSVGKKEIRGWTIETGTTAFKAAGKIHSDFQKGFIKAQVISYEDFIAYRGERGAKEAGKMRFEGKEYIVKDGDIINFLFNV